MEDNWNGNLLLGCLLDKRRRTLGVFLTIKDPGMGVARDWECHYTTVDSNAVRTEFFYSSMPGKFLE